MTDTIMPAVPPAKRHRGAIITVVLTIAIVIAAIAVGQRDGFSAIGFGGMNTRLLPRVGDPAPDVVVADAVTGEPVRLSDYRGRPVWINFWGSWCPPCRVEFPDLQAAYAGFLAPNGVALLAVSLDESAERAWGYARQNGGTFTILSDPDRRQTGYAYPIANFPTHILVGADGIVRAVILAPIDQPAIEAAARTYLLGPEGTPDA